MTYDLKQQLLDLANCRHDDFTVGYEAADRIEELEREVAVLKTTPAHLRHDLHCVAHDLAQQVRDAEQERDQLREQVKMLRDALEVTHELYANASSGYGFARPDNPHNFHCDIDCCSKEEIEAHSKACDDYAAGRKVSNDSWGIGNYCDEYAPAIKALAATEPTSIPTDI